MKSRPVNRSQREPTLRRFTLVIACAAALSTFAGGCGTKAEQSSRAPTADHLEQSSSYVDAETGNAGDGLQPSIVELKRATEALLETTTQLKEFSHEFTVGLDGIDDPPPKYPDES